MITLSTVADCRAYRQKTLGPSKRLALVPTMGALHAGHAALIEAAQQHAEHVVVSIFVNPLQFGPTEDYSRYPRTEEADLALCRQLGVSAVFLPSVEAIYPLGQIALTQVVPPKALTEQLCGLHRPGHFTGVATVVCKLFNMIQPQVAVFGQKDAQQLAVLRWMVRDLDLPIDLIACPTLREPDGLALSSRNRYLQTPAERAAARVLSRCLFSLRDKRPFSENFLDNTGLQAFLQAHFSEICQAEAATHGFLASLLTLEYIEAVDGQTFLPVNRLDTGTCLLLAARIALENGQSVRLIDNINLG